MRTTVALIILAAVLATATGASAQQPIPSPVKVKATLSASRGKGTKRQPVPVRASYTFHVTTTDGSRPEAVKRFVHSWEGVRSYGRYFPTCSLTKIATAQSDSVCPKGSLVGTGKIHSLVGPGNNFAILGSPCDRATHTYNAGQDKLVVIFTGPGSACLGTSYTAPFAASWTGGGIGGGQNSVTIPPFEQTNPVPGLLVSTTDLSFTFPKRVIKVKGKKVSYLMSVGCKGKRSGRELYVRQPSGRSTTTTATAGAC